MLFSSLKEVDLINPYTEVSFRWEGTVATSWKNKLEAQARWVQDNIRASDELIGNLDNIIFLIGLEWPLRQRRLVIKVANRRNSFSGSPEEHLSLTDLDNVEKIRYALLAVVYSRWGKYG